MEKIYKYKPKIIAYILLSFLAQALVFWGFGIYALIKARPGNGAFALGVLFIAFSLLTSTSILAAYFKRQPIVISKTGISISFFGRIIRSIAWTDITIVSKTHYQDPVFSLNWNPLKSEWHRYHFIGSNKNTLWVDDGLKDLRSFLDEVNIYIHQYNIPVIYVDRMPSAAETVRSSGFDLATQKKLRQEGLRHSLSEL